MIEAKTHVDFPEDEFMKYFNEQADDLYREMAQKCEHYAMMNVRSHTGNIQNTNKEKKSKYEDGGWICIAEGGKDGKGNHAFLVEYGTEGPRKPLLKKLMKFEIDGKVIFARVVAKMPAKPFMRPAKDKVIAELRSSSK